MSVRINKVYTGVGDGGDTRLAHGRKVSKNDPRVEAYGPLDDLGSHIGYLCELVDDPDIRSRLRRLQQELFDCGSLVATLPADLQPLGADLPPHFITRLEDEMDGWNEALPELRSFVLAGGGPAGAWAHVCRTVARNAERAAQPVQIPARVRVYLNRISDWLFILARHLAATAAVAETLWEPGRTDRTAGTGG